MRKTVESDQEERPVRSGSHGTDHAGPILHELRECHLQPGSLRISKQGCGLRYLKAREIRLRIPRTAFEMIHKQGLDICLTCSEGRVYATEIPPRRLENKNKRE